jgi:hypothetical protein
MRPKTFMLQNDVNDVVGNDVIGQCKIKLEMIFQPQIDLKKIVFGIELLG